MAPEIAPLYLLIQPNPVSSCREVKPGPVIVSRRRWLLKSVRRFEISEIHFFFLEGSLFLGPVCKQASAFPHLLEPTGMGFAGVFCTKGELRSPVTTGRALQRGLGFIVIFFSPVVLQVGRSNSNASVASNAGNAALPHTLQWRGGGDPWVDGPMDIWMDPWTFLWHPPMGLASGWALPSGASFSTAWRCILQRLRDAKMLKEEFCSPGEGIVLGFGGKVSQSVHIYVSLWKGNLLFPPSSEAL